MNEIPPEQKENMLAVLDDAASYFEKFADLWPNGAPLTRRVAAMIETGSATQEQVNEILSEFSAEPSPGSYWGILRNSFRGWLDDAGFSTKSATW